MSEFGCHVTNTIAPATLMQVIWKRLHVIADETKAHQKALHSLSLHFSNVISRQQWWLQ